MFKPTPDVLKKYIKENYRHSNYHEAVKNYNEIRVHSDGKAPGNLIEERRPGESETILAYRKKIYQPKTKTVFMKVLNLLGKIRRSSDWAIKYDEKASPKTIDAEETLQEYCEKKYPEYASITKWYFDVALKQQVIDPNAIALVHWHKDLPSDGIKYGMPVITIFNSDQVYDYVKDEFAFLLSSEKSTYQSADGKTTHNNGDIYYFVTPDSTFKLSQNSEDKSKFNIVEFKHKLSILPAFRLGAIEKSKNFYESRISGMIPSLNVAVTIYSDKQAEIVQHVHSKLWTYETEQCKECSGTGKIAQKKGAPIECTKCKGGVVPTSPYSNMIINPSNLPLGEKSFPIPPSGYIQKSDVALMVKAISDEIKQEIYDAYSAVSMEFLMDTPLAESGIAKTVDRDELNNFVYGVAEDAVGVIDKGYYLIALMRYGYQLKDQKVVKEMCPKIPVPEKYDLLSSNYYLEKYKVAKDAKISPQILSYMEIEFATKELYNNPEVAQFMQSVYALNPLPSTTEEDKMVQFSNKWITLEDAVISANIVAFIRRALQEKPDFFKLKVEEQKKIITKYAEEKIKENSAAADMVDDEASEDGSGSGSGAAGGADR